MDLRFARACIAHIRPNWRLSFWSTSSRGCKKMKYLTAWRWNRAHTAGVKTCFSIEALQASTQSIYTHIYSVIYRIQFLMSEDSHKTHALMVKIYKILDTVAAAHRSDFMHFFFELLLCQKVCFEHNLLYIQYQIGTENVKLDYNPRIYICTVLGCIFGMYVCI